MIATGPQGLPVPHLLGNPTSDSRKGSILALLIWGSYYVLRNLPNREISGSEVAETTIKMLKPCRGTLRPRSAWPLWRRPRIFGGAATGWDGWEVRTQRAYLGLRV